MDDAIKKVIIALELDSDKYTKNAVEAKKEIVALEAAQKSLKKSGLETSENFQLNAQKLQLLRKEYQDNQKAAAQLNQLNKENITSNQDQKAVLSLLTAERNKMTVAEREGTQIGKDLSATIDNVSNALKTNEMAVGNTYRNVGNYEQSLQGLKKALKDARSEMVAIAASSGMNSKEFHEAAAKAGEVEDKIGDIKKASKEMATGSGLGQLKNQLGGIGQSLGELDFKEASERAAQFGNTMKTMSFSNVIAGAKAFGTTMLELGKSLLLNPIFMLVAVIAGVSAAVYNMVSAFIDSNKELESTTKLLTEHNTAMATFRATYQETYIAISELTGRISKAQAEMLKNDVQVKQEQLKLQTKHNEDVKALAKELELDLTEMENGRMSETYKGNFAEMEKKKQFNVEKEKLEKAHLEELQALDNNARLNKTKIQIQEYVDEIKMYKDKSAKFEDEIKKQHEKDQQLLDEQISATRALNKKLEDEKIQLMKDGLEKEQAQILLNNKRAIEDINSSKATAKVKADALSAQHEIFLQQMKQAEEDYAAKKKDLENKKAEDVEKEREREVAAAAKSQQEIDDIEKNADEQRKKNLDNQIKIANGHYNKQLELLQTEHAAALISDEEYEIKKTEITKQQSEHRRKIENEVANDAKQLISDVVQIMNNRYQSEINASNAARDNQVNNLQKQLDQGIISQQTFDREKKKLDDKAHKEESDLKKKQFKADKQAAEIKIAISTAQAVMTAFAENSYPENIIFAALAVAAGAAELAVVESQPTPAFAKGGLSGKKITSSDGTKIHRRNGDNLLATVKTGEVILNEQQQARLGGDRTFKAIGVPGFAGGGITADAVSAPVEQRFEAANNLILLAKLMPTPIVLVEDINSAQKTNIDVTSQGNI